MAELRGTKTEKNLQYAFVGESQARNKYTYFASAAKKEGYEKIAAIFLEIADNEKEHAKLHFQALQGIGNTAANLRAAAAGENEETESMYPRMAKEAREEGFEQIAAVFEGVGKIEKAHRELYRKLLKSVEEGAVFKKSTEIAWKCRNCGHIHVGSEAPQVCPVCKHPRSYFEPLSENI